MAAVVFVRTEFRLIIFSHTLFSQTLFYQLLLVLFSPVNPLSYFFRQKMRVPLFLLAVLSTAVSGIAVSDPKIDLFKLDSHEGNKNRWCQSTMCPKYVHRS